RMTDVQHSCRPSWRAPVEPCKLGGTTSSRRSGRAGSLTMIGRSPDNGWVGPVPFQRWIARLPANHEWRQAHDRLRSETASIPWKSRGSQDKAVSVGLRVLIARGYSALGEITDDDL